MGDSFALPALRRKRAHLAGEIKAAQKAIDGQRQALAKLDAVILMFDPDADPEAIAAINPRRAPYYDRGEQTRLILSALREADKPVTVRYVADYVFAAIVLDLGPKERAVAVERVRFALSKLAARGVTRKIVERPDTWWDLAP